VYTIKYQVSFSIDLLLLLSLLVSVLLIDMKAAPRMELRVGKDEVEVEVEVLLLALSKNNGIEAFFVETLLDSTEDSVEPDDSFSETFSDVVTIMVVFDGFLTEMTGIEVLLSSSSSSLGDLVVVWTTLDSNEVEESAAISSSTSSSLLLLPNPKKLVERDRPAFF
jgi:hypothetical protein